MTRPILLVLSLALAFVQSAAAQRPSPTVLLPGFRSPVRMDSVGQSIRIDAPPSAVFPALRAIFDSLGIAPTLADSTAGIIGNGELKVLRRFANAPMSRWVDCGIGQSGPTANSYRVHLAIVAMLSAEGTRATALRIAVAAGAQALGGGLADPIACASTGQLEERMHTLVRAHTTNR